MNDGRCHLDSARCLFLDGPIAVYVMQGPSAKVLEAYDRLRRMVEIAARRMEEEEAKARPGMEIPLARPR